MRSFIFVAFMVMLIVQAACSRETSKETQEEHHEDAHTDTSGLLEINKEGQEKAGLQFVTVEQSSVQNLLFVTGKVVADESRMVHIRPLAAGQIQRVLVQPGSDVTSGQPLILIDSIELGDLENEYLKARSNVSVAEQSLKRAENLVKIGAIAQSEYERRKSDYESALASLRSIETKTARYGIDSGTLSDQSAKSSGGQNTLRSPINGVLLEFNAAAGEMADPDVDLFTIGNLESLWVEANVHETDLGLVQLGQQATIRSNAYPDLEFTGEITKIGDVLDVSTRTIKVRCQVPNPERKLKLEMFVDVTIPTSKTREALIVPGEAVQEIDHEPVVFVKQGEDRFEKRDIQLGQKTDRGFEVTSGLKKGEVVVSTGSFSLKSEFLKAEIGSEEHGH